MWISQLAEQTGLPVATIKFYLREGLLHPGTSTGATRATYDDSHVRRLRLVRALVDVGGLSLDAVRETLAAVDDETLSLHDVVATAAARLTNDRSATAGEPAMSRVDRLLRRMRWKVPSEMPHRQVLAQALEAMDVLDQPVSEETLRFYAEAMRSVAEREVASVPVAGRERATEYVVVGTLLVEPVLLSLRRLAHADLSRRRLGRRR